MTQQIESPPAVAVREMSYPEFLNWDGSNQHVEWINGKVTPMAPAGDVHQDIAGFLLSIVRTYVNHLRLGAVRHDPFQMKTGPTLPGRAPDIIFIAKKNLARLKPSYCDGPADLVIEIISPGSRSVDRGEKFYEYEQGGVREYWLIDPTRKQAEFYQLGRDGIYHLVPTDADGIFRSSVVKGLWVKVEWFWQKPLPSELDVLKEWKLAK